MSETCRQLMIQLETIQMTFVIQFNDKNKNVCTTNIHKYICVWVIKTKSNVKTQEN